MAAVAVSVAGVVGSVDIVVGDSVDRIAAAAAAAVEDETANLMDEQQRLALQQRIGCWSDNAMRRRKAESDLRGFVLVLLGDWAVVAQNAVQSALVVGSPAERLMTGEQM